MFETISKLSMYVALRGLCSVLFVILWLTSVYRFKVLLLHSDLGLPTDGAVLR